MESYFPVQQYVFERNLRQWLNGVNEIVSNFQLHIGDFKWSARTEDFGGWLRCDGRTLSPADYPDLYSVIGLTYGGEEGVSFNLPDIRGRVPGCFGNNGTTNRSIGDTIGHDTHTLTITEMPSHAHTGTTANAGLHDHSGLTGSGGAHSHTITDPGHTHSMTTRNDDFNNSGANPPGFAADSAGTRTWNDVINSSATGISINGIGDHTHAISNVGTVHSHTFATSNIGGGASFSIVQPTAFVGSLFIFSKVATFNTVYNLASYNPPA